MANTARFLWQRLESYHGLIYFVPEADQHYTALGLDPGMMGYFASRSAAMGPVPAEVVIATFYNFEPSRIRALVPLAWQRTTAQALWQARVAAADAALTRLLGSRLQSPDIAEAAALLRELMGECAPEGRPLFAGHLAQAWPDEPHLALWQAITLLREYRGDGHIAALTVEAVSGIEALVIHGATGSVPPAVLQAAWLEQRGMGSGGRAAAGAQLAGRRRHAHARRPTASQPGRAVHRRARGSAVASPHRGPGHLVGRAGQGTDRRHRGGRHLPAPLTGTDRSDRSGLEVGLEPLAAIGVEPLAAGGVTVGEVASALTGLDVEAVRGEVLGGDR